MIDSRPWTGVSNPTPAIDLAQHGLHPERLVGYPELELVKHHRTRTHPTRVMQFTLNSHRDLVTLNSLMHGPGFHRALEFFRPRHVPELWLSRQQSFPR